VIAPSKGQKQPGKGRLSSSVWDPNREAGRGEGEARRRRAGVPDGDESLYEVPVGFLWNILMA
jgi:hypothetical protein